MLILLFRYVFAILAGGPAIPLSPGWTGPSTNRVGSRGARASRESEFLAGGPEHARLPLSLETDIFLSWLGCL